MVVASGVIWKRPHKTNNLNSEALTSEGRWETGALDIAGDELVADDINGAHAGLLAGVNTAENLFNIKLAVSKLRCEFGKNV